MGSTAVLRMTSALGLAAMVGLAWGLSEQRSKVRWRPVIWGLGLQFLLAVLILRTGFGRTFFEAVNASFDVLTNATKEGAKFVFGHLPENYEIGAMLIAFIGLIYLVDLAVKGVTGYTFAHVMGWFFYPFAFLMGVPWQDVGAVAQLLGKKTVLNEFLAYADFKPLIASGALSPRSVMIATYALCGFANPGSLGILLGGLTAMIPERRSEIAELGIKSLIAGTLTCFAVACIAGMLSE